MSGPTGFRPSNSSNSSPARPRLQISPWVGVLIVMTAASAFLVNLRRSPGENAVSYAAGSLVGVLLLVGIVGGITFLVSKRSSKAANISIVVVCMLSLLSTAANRVSSRSSSDRAVINQIEAQADALRAEQKAEFERTGSAGLGADRANRALDQMAQTAKQGSGEESRALQISVEVMKGLTTIAGQYEAKIAEANELGGLDGKGISFPADLDRRVRVWNEAGTLASQITAKTEGLETEMEAALAAAGISATARRTFMAGMTEGGRLAVMTEVHRYEEKVIAGVKDRLALLKRSFGKWHYDDAASSIIFDDEADLEEFNEAGDRIAQASEAQTKAQQRLINIQSRGKR